MMTKLGKVKLHTSKWFYALLSWRERHIKEKNLILILALITGVLCGFAALIFKWLIHFIASTLLFNIDITSGNYLYLLYSVDWYCNSEFLCQIRGKRQYFPRCDTGIICDIPE